MGWEKALGEMYSWFDREQIAILEHIDPLAKGLMDKPDAFIDRVKGVMDRALDELYTDKDGQNNRSFISAFCGGPHEAIPVAVYNAVGCVYPYLSREQKDRALEAVLYEMDKLNYIYVNSIHTPNVREPLLLADITVARHLYWPGLDEAKDVAQRYDTFFDLQKDLLDERGVFKKSAVRSDFLVAYGLLRSDISQFGEAYLKYAHQGFIKRVAQAVAAVNFAFRTPLQKKVRLVRLHEVLPSGMLKLIKEAEPDWVTATHLCSTREDAYKKALEEERMMEPCSLLDSLGPNDYLNIRYSETDAQPFARKSRSRSR